MDLVQFLRLFLKHAVWILTLAASLAVMVFHMTKDEKRTYSTEGLVNTGLVSGYNIESQGGGKTDYFYTSAELDNILNLISAYETIEELGTHLLAEVMSAEQPGPDIILPVNLQELRLAVGGNLWDSLAVPGDFPSTFIRLVGYRNQHPEANAIHDILYGKHPLFGIESLGGVKVAREGKSDMIRLSYTTIDPAICQRTLIVLIDIFRRKHREIKESQTANVLDYFEESTAAAARRLREAEDRLKLFQEESRIINYYEQTRFIANKREDLYEDYLNELMNLVSADSALRTLERQMGQRKILSLINQDLMHKRDSLSLVVSRMAQLQLLQDDTLRARPTIDSLRNAAMNLRRELSGSTQSITQIYRTPNGAQLEDLLSNWLENLLKMEDAAARLRVIERRKEEFEDIYDAFAPSAPPSSASKEIEVAEKEYLENLHSLNQARLHKQSMLMATNLKVVDEPFFPTSPDPSSRMMLVIVAFLVGFILPLALVIAMEFFDKTLKKPAWARRATELEIIGVLPRLGQKKRARARVEEEFLEERPVGLLLQNLKIELSRREFGKPIRILILSTRTMEGKTMVGYLLAKYLRSFRATVAFFTPEDGHDEGGFPPMIAPLIGHEHTFRYHLGDDLFEMRTEEQMVDAQGAQIPAGTDYYLTELPGLLSHPYPVELIRRADLILLVARANRTWIDADRFVMERIGTISRAPVRLILNGVDVEYLEQSMGDLPKRRSFVRRIAKRFLKAGFSSKSRF